MQEAGSGCTGKGPVTTGWQRGDKKRRRESEAGEVEPGNTACIFNGKGYFLPEQLPEDCDGFFNKGFLKPGEDVFLENLFESNWDLLREVLRTPRVCWTPSVCICLVLELKSPCSLKTNTSRKR